VGAESPVANVTWASRPGQEVTSARNAGYRAYSLPAGHVNRRQAIEISPAPSPGDASVLGLRGPCPLLGAGQSHAELPRAALALGEARLRRFACRNTRPAARHVPLSANADPVRPRMSNATWFEAVVRWLGGGRLDQRTASGRTSGIHCPHCFIAVSVAKPTARNMLPPSVASTRRFSRSTSAALNRLVPASTSSP
jgi:hypothetical protein